MKDGYDQRYCEEFDPNTFIASDGIERFISLFWPLEFGVNDIWTDLFDTSALAVPKDTMYVELSLAYQERSVSPPRRVYVIAVCSTVGNKSDDRRLVKLSQAFRAALDQKGIPSLFWCPYHLCRPRFDFPRPSDPALALAALSAPPLLDSRVYR